MIRKLPTSTAAERNKEPILAVLATVLPATGKVLEIASGGGQHICFFAGELPAIHWQPTEPDADSREAIVTRIRAAKLANVATALPLDVLTPHWPVATDYDAIVCINMIHISPWAASEALFSGAARHLRTRGKLVLYGPYLENGTAVQSNLDFDASLKRRNAEWGLRDMDAVTQLAVKHGFTRQQIVLMPANNLSVVFAKDA